MLVFVLYNYFFHRGGEEKKCGEEGMVARRFSRMEWRTDFLRWCTHVELYERSNVIRVDFSIVDVCKRI